MRHSLGPRVAGGVSTGRAERPRSNGRRARGAATFAAVAALATAMGPAAAAAATPVAPPDGEQITGSDVVLRWAMADDERAECLEWAYRPETSYEGGPFLDPAGETCSLGPRDVAYLLDDLGVERYFWHVQTYRVQCIDDEYGPDCLDGASTWGPTAFFDSVVPPRSTRGDPHLPSYTFCGWKDFGNGWTFDSPGPGAFMIGFAHGMSCRAARRNINRVRYPRRTGHRPYRLGYRCVRLEGGWEYEDVRCVRRGSRGRVKFRYQTGA